MKQERTRVAVQEQAQAAELDARNAEYQDLPRTPLEFMPVRIEVAVTESQSEKKAQVALAEMFGGKANVPDSTPGNTSSGLFSRSVSAGDVLTEPNAPDAASNFERTRAQYFDAWAETQATEPGGRSEELQRRLKAAKAAYNEARRSIGLEQIK